MSIRDSSIPEDTAAKSVRPNKADTKSPWVEASTELAFKLFAKREME